MKLLILDGTHHLVSSKHTLLDPEKTVVPSGYKDFLVLGNTIYRMGNELNIDVNIGTIPELSQKEMLNKHGILTPKTYAFKNISTALIFLSEQDKKFVLKKSYQNRGVGKVVVDYDYLEGLIHCKSEEDYLEYIGEDNLGQIRNEEEKFLLYRNYKNLYLEEFVNIKKEYRLILINKYDDEGGYAYDLYERKNMRVGKSDQGIRPKDNKLLLTSLVDEENIDKLLTIMEEEKCVHMSFDLYEDEKGNVGVIEYNPDFGIRGYDTFTLNILKDATTIGLENILTKKQKNEF